ncbi:MAG: entericidin A/B family lipoprotein [Janthinobacterium lividum]
MRTIMIAAVVLGALAVTACNTVRGAGEDVSSAGKAVSTTAKKAS